MTYSSVSTKYQVVIPKEIRRTVGLKPGQRLMVYAKGPIIYLIPEASLSSLRGIFEGMDRTNIRDEEDRL